MSFEWLPFTELLLTIVDNRGRTCPVSDVGIPLIATNCVDRSNLYPSYNTTRFVSDVTYKTWFRGHPLPGDILFVCKGSPGRTNLVPNPVDFCIAQDMVAVRADPQKITPKYLFAVLRSSVVQAQIDSLHVGTMIPHFKKGDFGKLSIPVPPFSDQQEIGDLYFSFSERITLLRDTNTTLEAIAQALFKSWFVDFDPVHAKQQGRAPEGMDAETAALFPDSLEESELGLVPRGWEIKSIGEISKILNGFAFKSEDYVEHDSGIFVLRTTNFSSDGYTKRQSRDVFLPKIFLKSHAKFLCEPFDFHLVMVGASVGATSTLLPHMLPAFRNQNMWCFRPLNEFLSKFFIHEMVKLKIVEALRSTSGSAREFLRKGDFEKNKLVLPPHKLLSDFDDKVSVIKNKIAVNENQSVLLMSIRDTLLPRLISGQLRLPEATSLMEDEVTA